MEKVKIRKKSKRQIIIILIILGLFYFFFNTSIDKKSEIDKRKNELVNEIVNQMSFLEKKCRPEKLKNHLSPIEDIKKFVLAKKDISNDEYDLILNYLAIKVVSVLEGSS